MIRWIRTSRLSIKNSLSVKGSRLDRLRLSGHSRTAEGKRKKLQVHFWWDGVHKSQVRFETCFLASSSSPCTVQTQQQHLIIVRITESPELGQGRIEGSQTCVPFNSRLKGLLGPVPRAIKRKKEGVRGQGTFSRPGRVGGRALGPSLLPA